MKSKATLLVFAALLGFGLLLTMGVGTASAQDDTNTTSADKNIAQKRGVSGALQTTKPEDESDGPTKLQMAIGVGSIFVMIAVLKWL